MITREMMKKEALERMKMMNIIPQTIKEFAEHDIINKSTYGGILFWLDDEEKEIIKKFEEEHNCLVYHAIKCNYRMCDGDIMTCFDLLYVSENEEEWEMDRENMKSDNYMYVYSISNLCDNGEFGGIAYKSMNGGVARA